MSGSRAGCLAIACLAAATAAATPAVAVAGAVSGGSEAILIAQIVVLVLLGRLMGEGMQRIGQPAVMGMLLAGIVLGPSVFGALWPHGRELLFPAVPAQKSMIEAISQLGILMILLLAGMETDISLVRRVGRAAASVSITGICLPFAAGFALGEFLPDWLLPDPNKRLITSLFLGTALSISSVKIVAAVVREMNFVRRNIGQIILASAVIDDTIGWIIIAITFGLASHGSLDWVSLGGHVAGTFIFLAVSFTIGRRLVFQAIRWTNDTFISDAPVIAAILVIMGVMALTTHLIGVHSVLGAFVAGMLVGQSPILTRRIDDELRGLTAGLFMPVFFGMAGISADLTILKHPDLLLLTVGLIVIASIGKAAGAFTGGWFGGLTTRESLALAAGMNARGSTEVIVASIGLSMGALSDNLYTMIVAMAVVTTMAMPPTLRWALDRLPMRKEERQRLEREQFESKGFAAGIERILAAVDASPKGQFASRIVGLLAGSRGIPVTILRLENEETTQNSTAPQSSGEAVRAAAESARERGAEEKDTAAVPVEVIEKTPEAPPQEAVAHEASKGYDLLVIGVEPIVGRRGGFDPQVSRMAAGFTGPLSVITARGIHEQQPIDAALSILVPVTGSEVSRRGAEVAIALARAAGAPIKILSIASGDPEIAQRRPAHMRREVAEILKEIRMVADFYEVEIKTAMRTDIAAENAILREARRGRHNLIVMGVSRRPGENLAFGHVATAVLESADRSLMFVSS